MTAVLPWVGAPIHAFKSLVGYEPVALTADSLVLPLVVGHPYAIKMLVNHSTPDKQDVTAGYITPELERLRKPMELISDRIRAICRVNRQLISVSP